MVESRVRTTIYRVRQFVAALLAGPLPSADQQLVAQHLTGAQLTLFQQMVYGDQRHGVAVARRLLAQGWRDPALIQAALLHDVGKAEGNLRLGYRAAIVLLNAVWPAVLQRLAGKDVGWRRPFHVHARHPEIGARLASAAGSSPRVAELIARHQAFAGGNSGVDPLAALQAADEQC